MPSEVEPQILDIDEDPACAARALGSLPFHESNYGGGVRWHEPPSPNQTASAPVTIRYAGKDWTPLFSVVESKRGSTCVSLVFFFMVECPWVLGCHCVDVPQQAESATFCMIGFLKQVGKLDGCLLTVHRLNDSTGKARTPSMAFVREFTRIRPLFLSRILIFRKDQKAHVILRFIQYCCPVELPIELISNQQELLETLFRGTKSRKKQLPDVCDRTSKRVDFLEGRLVELAEKYGSADSVPGEELLRSISARLAQNDSKSKSKQFGRLSDRCLSELGDSSARSKRAEWPQRKMPETLGGMSPRRLRVKVPISLDVIEEDEMEDE